MGFNPGGEVLRVVVCAGHRACCRGCGTPWHLPLNDGFCNVSINTCAIVRFGVGCRECFNMFGLNEKMCIGEVRCGHAPLTCAECMHGFTVAMGWDIFVW